MTITAGLDVGSGAIKAVVMEVDGPTGSGARLLGHAVGRIRRRDILAVVDEVFNRAVAEAGVSSIAYVATTGEGEDIPFATGHFYGMTTHARGAQFLEPRARAVLDAGALHARAVAMDPAGRVVNYKMTSQCASGSGQFIENIARYLGVSLAEVGQISRQGVNPEKVSSICAVLAETDVINMVSRGISTPDILRGIHESMAGRFARLIRSVNAVGVVFVSGGLAGDEGLLAALDEALAPSAAPKRPSLRGGVEEPITLVTHPLSIHAGAIGAALWGAYRHDKLDLGDFAWTSAAPTSAAPTSATPA
ncbi:MAG: benzoyl-CoA reductase subunit D [Pseudomonadota bacterium]|nr:benzoyl-CoA reductase subunit D [Pseudomonadota bacterium]